MLKPVRRVVTGNNERGRSYVVSDEIVEAVSELPHWPGRGLTTLWLSDRMPASNADEDLADTVPGAGYVLNVGSGIVSLMIEQIPPESDLETMTPEQRAEALAPLASRSSAAIEVDLTKSSLMHATDTADCAVLVSGTLTVLLDEMDVDLRPGDAIIQRGTNHALVNRGSEPAILACLIMDAAPLERGQVG